MQRADQERLERQELHALLSSGILAKSPNLEKLLTYICEQYWQGKASELKEYNLGVEALGRPPQFDPGSSAIVRVEVHRLREKLKKFYENGGASHPIEIRLQPGRYVPQFVWRDEAEQTTSSATVRPESDAGFAVGLPARIRADPLGSQMPAAGAGKSSPPQGQRGTRLALLLVCLGVAGAVVAALLVFRHRAMRAIAVSAAKPPQITPAAAGPRPDAARIIAGYFRKSYIGRSGDRWQGDTDFQAGSAGENGDHLIARTSDPTLFETYRQGEFSYNVPLRPGTYNLWLYFVETQYGPGTLLGGGETSRLFRVQVNGRTVLDNFDVFADAGGNFIADVRVFKDIFPAPDGAVHIRFVREVQDPFINAIKLVAAPAGTLLPVRIVAQDDSYTDHAGRIWNPDVYFRGGRQVLRRSPVSGALDPGLFAGERYGNFDYAIPVARGKYGVTLYFAERYFGPGKPGGGGAGSRVFNVVCNDKVLLHNFDVFKEARGADRALIKTFHGLTANPQGKLLIQFQPVVNYALVDAISVVDESR